jgi:SAM-dependent methyltransferase
MMWFNKRHPLALYMDKCRESLRWDDAGMKALEVDPDVLADFTDMPFPDESFNLVVFDPPHMATLGKNSKMAQLYGRLVGDWSVDISEGFRECLRVLKPLGVLIFKWNESDIPLADVLRCAPIEPLFGHQTKRHGKTHWIAFLKPNSIYCHYFAVFKDGSQSLFQGWALPPPGTMMKWSVAQLVMRLPALLCLRTR